jgi:hypothetical protein
MTGNTLPFTETKVILPVWHNISLEELQKYSPMLSGRLAVKSDEGLEKVRKSLANSVKRWDFET